MNVICSSAQVSDHNLKPVKGKIILLNGTSSAGKSTLCKALKTVLNEPFWYMASDQFIEIGMAPTRKNKGGKFDWGDLRPTFFDGFHHVLPAFAGAGNNLIVEHIVEVESWLDDLLRLLHGFDVFFVGVHCPLEELEKRERERGDRKIGEARYHLKTHDYCQYDFEVDSRKPAADNAEQIVKAWHERTKPSIFEQMYLAKLSNTHPSV